MSATVGTMKYDGLIYDGKFPVDTTTVKLRAGQGILLRGTILCTSTDGNAVILGTTAVEGEALIPSSILADDVDTGTSLIAEAYRTGHFAREKLISKVAVTEVIENQLRLYGILISSIQEI